MRRSKRVTGSKGPQEPTPQQPQEPDAAEGDTIIELRDGVPCLHEVPPKDKKQ